MKVKIIIDDNIIIDEEISDKFSNFTINEGDFKLEYSKNNNTDIDIKSKSNFKTNKDKRKKSRGLGVKAEMERYSKPVKEAANMSGKELENLFSDLFVEEKPKPILIDEDEIDKITEELEEKFKNQ